MIGRCLLGKGILNKKIFKHLIGYQWELRTSCFFLNAPYGYLELETKNNQKC